MILKIQLKEVTAPWHYSHITDTKKIRMTLCAAITEEICPRKETDTHIHTHTYQHCLILLKQSLMDGNTSFLLQITKLGLPSMVTSTLQWWGNYGHARRAYPRKSFALLMGFGDSSEEDKPVFVIPKCGVRDRFYFLPTCSKEVFGELEGSKNGTSEAISMQTNLYCTFKPLLRGNPLANLGEEERIFLPKT